MRQPPTSFPASAAAAPVARNAAAASFAALDGRIQYLDKTDVELVRKAYRFADAAHLGQLRRNGEPYITHPISVAQQCTEWKLDAQALMAALLHDVLEDCGVDKAELAREFGAPVAELVDGLTKLDKLEFGTREENQAESFRKMLLAMAKDVRVILIKLADRTHNMRTMADMPRSKWERISSETLEIYAPIAHRLGLNQTYRELQDLAFKHLKPWRYGVLSKAAAKARGRRRDLIQKVHHDVEAAFAKTTLQPLLEGREKSLYSIYRKMKEKNLSFAQVTDMYGFRIVVPQVIDCYTALGILHQLYKPLHGKFKDYIAIAKSNGYQSLHTTLVGPSAVNIEFQMRTPAMDAVAESGIAAHWLYKEQPNQNKPSERLGARWLQSLLDIQNETRDAREFWDHIKVDLFPDAVYVFTPKGQIMALQRGATVVDFAYAIHSDIGDRTVAAKINEELSPLRTELSNGDVVEIITAPVSKPNPAWLGFVRTGRARARIRQHLKSMAQEESEFLGEKLLAQALRAEGLDGVPARTAENGALWGKLLRFTDSRSRAELLTEIGMGKHAATIVAKRLAALMIERGDKPNAILLTQERFTAHEKVSQGSVQIDGSESASVRFAACCGPIPGDAIVGYLGRGEGLIIHRTPCPTAHRLQNKDSERFIAVEWADDMQRPFEVRIVVTVNNDKGVLARIAAILASAEADIIHIDIPGASMQETIDLQFVIAVKDTAHLDSALRSLQRATPVLKVIRAVGTAVRPH